MPPGLWHEVGRISQAAREQRAAPLTRGATRPPTAVYCNKNALRRAHFHPSFHAISAHFRALSTTCPRPVHDLPAFLRPAHDLAPSSATPPSNLRPFAGIATPQRSYCPHLKRRAQPPDPHRPIHTTPGPPITPTAPPHTPRQPAWGDALLLLLVAAALAALISLARTAPADLAGPTIALEPTALPLIALLSTARMAAG